MDELELILGQFSDNMIQMNVVCGANLNVISEKIFLKENCQ